METFICNQYGERLHISNTENIKICLRFLSYPLNTCKNDFFISQGSAVTMPKVRWVGYCRMRFVANFICFPAVQKIENRLRFDKVTESSKVGTFLRHSVDVGGKRNPSA